MSSVPPFPPGPGGEPQQPYQQPNTGRQPYAQQSYPGQQYSGQPYPGQQSYSGQYQGYPPQQPGFGPPSGYQPAPPPRNNGVWIAAVVGAVIVAVAAIVVLVTVAGNRSSHSDARSSTTAQPATTAPSASTATSAPTDTTDFDRFAVESLNIGDCFTIDGTGAVTTGACTAAHTDQVFAILTSRADTAGGVVGDAKNQCNDSANQSRVDMGAVPGDANVAYFFPRAGAFDGGDRRIECVVEAPTGVTYKASYVH